MVPRIDPSRWEEHELLRWVGLLGLEPDGQQGLHLVAAHLRRLDRAVPLREQGRAAVADLTVQLGHLRWLASLEDEGLTDEEDLRLCRAARRAAGQLEHVLSELLHQVEGGRP